MSDTSEPFTIFLHLLGSVCLLLWGSYTVRSTVEKTFSASLNALIQNTSRSVPRSIVTGALAALLMQSATATILLSTGMLATGSLSLVAAMGIVLGADLGSALATRILFVDLSLLPSAILAIGLFLHIGSHSHRGKKIGQIIIGFGLIFLAIQLMKAAIAPISSSPVSPEWMSVLQSASWVGLIVMAVGAWLAHSSVAMILIVASLAHSGVIPAELVVPMVIGANIGAGFIALPLVERGNLPSRSVVVSNIIFRFCLALITLVTQSYWIDFLPLVSDDAGIQVIILHILFNATLILLFAPFAGKIVNRVQAYLQDRNRTFEDVLQVSIGSSLDYDLVTDPESAIAAARREAFRLGDSTEAFYTKSLEMFHAKDQSQIDFMIESDHEINSRNKAILQYLTEVRRHLVGTELEAQLDNVLQFSATMENVGDTISYSLSRLATKRLDRSAILSDEGMQEITQIHGQVLDLMQSVIRQFSNQDSWDAGENRKRIQNIRSLCSTSISFHRRRLSAKQTNSLGSSSIHQDTVRDLLQIALLLEIACDSKIS